MFNSEDLKCLDPQYFIIIATDAFDVTIMSRNTGHYWYLHNPEYPEQGTVITSTRLLIRIISTAGRTPCGRRYGGFGSTINGK